MIHMLSRFDLKPEVDFDTFGKHYQLFFEQCRALDLVQSIGQVGTRVNDTPMDTDTQNDQKYYAIMTFRDRKQMDQAYDYIGSGKASREVIKAHNLVNDAVVNSVFTCWEET